MKATIESTNVITSVDGQPVRVWEGVTESGAPFVAFIARLAIEKGSDFEAEFHAELTAMAPPLELSFRDALIAFSTRML